jgi:hypothetical protein
MAASQPMTTREFNEHMRTLETLSPEDIKKLKEALSTSAIFWNAHPTQFSIRLAHTTDEIGNERTPIPPGCHHIYTCQIIYVVIQEVVYFLTTKKPINPEDPVQFIQIFYTMCEGERLERLIPSMGIDLSRFDTLRMPGYQVYTDDNIAVVISDIDKSITVFDKNPSVPVAPDIYAGTR